MRRYRVLYWTFTNWDGDPDEIVLEQARAPTQADVEAALQEEVRSLRVEDLGPDCAKGRDGKRYSYIRHGYVYNIEPDGTPVAVSKDAPDLRGSKFRLIDNGFRGTYWEEFS